MLGPLAAATLAGILCTSCSIDQSALGPPDGAVDSGDPGACRAGTVDADGDPSNGCECILSDPPEEICNNADDDCDGTVDEGLTRTCGATVGACTAGVQRCREGIWNEECEGEVTPSEEVCDGSVDESCDGSVDEGCACTAGDSRACGMTIGACAEGTQACGSDGTWEECMGATIPTDETCNGADDDCDDNVDESLTRSCGTDVGACSTGIETCSSGAWGSCSGGVMPGDEVCEGSVDEDCDGNVDNGCDCVDGTTRNCGTDMGECSFGTETCSGGSWGSCSGGTDPGTEVCDAARNDEDCDGSSNEGCACDEGETRSCSSGSCTGTETCDLAGSWGSCVVSGGTMETCNGLDDDCDGTIDDDAGCEADSGCTLVRRMGHPYLLCTSGTGWTSAAEACAMLGYHLVVIDGAAEQGFVQTETSMESSGEWWIGLSDEDGDGNYEDDEWVEGSSSYRNWDSGNPDHTDQCVMLVNGDAGQWDDKGCGGSKQYVCEAP